MTRHARNSTAGAVFTYHERKKATESSGWGSQAMRFGKDSMREFDCCCLTLQPCKNPVITQDGYLYDKEAILEFIIHQKKTIAKKLKEFEKQKQKQKEEVGAAVNVQKQAELKSFVATHQIGKKFDEPQPGTSATISNVSGARSKELPSFWIPSLTPQAKKTEVKRPDEKVRCPMSNKPIKLKDLFDIKFTEIKDGSKKSLIAKEARYVCAVTNDVLGNSVPCAVLKTSGNVVTQECIEKIIKKDMIDPTNGKKLTEKDIVHLQRGSSGFSGSGHGEELKGKVHGPALMV